MHPTREIQYGQDQQRLHDMLREAIALASQINWRRGGAEHLAEDIGCYLIDALDVLALAQSEENAPSVDYEHETWGSRR